MYKIYLVAMGLCLAIGLHATCLFAQQTAPAPEDAVPAGAMPLPAPQPQPSSVAQPSAAQAQAAEEAAAQSKAQAQADKQKQMYTISGVPATYENVLKAAIRFGSIDMSSDQAIDDFAKLEYCDMYQRLHNDEFDWRRVRAALRKVVERDKATYPDVLYLERNEEFGEYNFPSGMLELKPNSVMNSRRLLLSSSYQPGFCGSSVSFPGTIIAELAQPIRLDGVELTEDEAKIVVMGISNDDRFNTRMAYGRFTIKITVGHEPRPGQPARLDATLQNITLYEDAEFARPFWSGISSTEVFSEQAGSFNGIPFKGIDPLAQTLDNSKPLTANTSQQPAKK